MLYCARWAMLYCARWATRGFVIDQRRRKKESMWDLICEYIQWLSPYFALYIYIIARKMSNRLITFKSWFPMFQNYINYKCLMLRLQNQPESDSVHVPILELDSVYNSLHNNHVATLVFSRQLIYEPVSDQVSWRQVRQAFQYTCSHLWVRHRLFPFGSRFSWWRSNARCCDELLHQLFDTPGSSQPNSCQSAKHEPTSAAAGSSFNHIS